jgi:periplasmic protein TonB
MKRKIIFFIIPLFLLFCANPHKTFCQNNSDKGPVLLVVEQMPSFPGGEEVLYKFLSNNIKYPSVAKEKGISGTVIISFVIEEDGSVAEAKVLRGIGGGCDEEALRVVNLMPKWSPGKQSGKPVRVQYNLPIKFTLN